MLKLPQYMKQYELTLVLNPDLTSEQQKALIDKVVKIVETAEGKVTKTNEWGKKELAYEIKNKNHGFYWFLNLEMSESSPVSLEKKLILENGILRYLICNQSIEVEPKLKNTEKVAKLL